MQTYDKILRELFSEARKRVFKGDDRTFLQHLQLISRLPANERNALLEPLIAQERPEKPQEMRFDVVEDFGSFTVPGDYDHWRYIDRARERYIEQKSVSFLDNWNGAWFTLSSYQLTPGERIKVTAVRQFAKQATLGEQLQYLDGQGAIYPSTHGLLLFLDHFRKQMVDTMWYVALDAESRLTMRQHTKHVLMVMRNRGRATLKMEPVWHIGPDVRILCFTKEG